MNRKLLLLFLSLTIISMSVCFLQDYEEIDPKAELTEEIANKLAGKFRPIFNFDNDEKFFPAAIEWFNIDWTSAPMNDNTAFVKYNFTGPSELDEKAPVYASVFENEDKSIRISYAVLYGYNGCGPYLKAQVNTLFGFVLDQKLPLCPMGLHNGDIERVTVTVEADRKTVRNVVYAYHDWDKVYTPSQIQMKGKRPVVYIANGSHASYPNFGEQVYLPAWQFKANTFSTNGAVAEKIDGKQITWAGYKVRLLKFQGQATADISKDESYLAFLFTGRLGAPITNTGFDYFIQEAMAYAEAVKSINIQAYQVILGGLQMLGSEVKKTSCYTLAGPGRDWW